MTSDIGKHVPTAAFRAALEQGLVQELRAGEPAFAPPSTRARRRDRWRTVLLLAMGLFLGVGGQMASAQVQESRERSELERAKASEREIAMLRLSMARLAVERAKRAFDIGAGTREALRDAESEARAMEVAAARIDLDIQEIRATASAPRDELWAPARAERDYVRERLQMEAYVAQQRLATMEVLAAEAQRRFNIGAIAHAGVSDANVDVARAKMDFQFLAKKLMLRDRFLKEGLTPERITYELQKTELMLGAEHAQARLQAAQESERLARSRTNVGVMDELDLKRAEIRVLEAKVELQRLLERHRALGPSPE